VPAGPSSWIRLRRGGSGLEVPGVYRIRAQHTTAVAGVAIILLLPFVLALVAPDLLTLGTAAGTALIAVGGAAAVWALYARPRLVVDGRGVAVVGALGTRRLGWDEVERFDCERVLLVVPVEGEPVAVPALPSVNLVRVVWGTAGPVDALAARLNEHLSDLRGGAPVPELLIATPDGRSDLRYATAGVALLAVLAGLARLAVQHWGS
jgi:Bacterial PH domain